MESNFKFVAVDSDMFDKQFIKYFTKYSKSGNHTIPLDVVINVGIIDRNIMTIKHQLEMLKTRDVIANVKSKVYTVVDADSYFNLAKLEEIVDSKEASSNAKEAIFNLDHNTTGQLQEDTLSADAFMKDVLGQTGDVISKQITSYTYNGTGLETAR